MAEPLTPEDIESLRALAFDASEDILFAQSEVRGLFATLDATRAAERTLDVDLARGARDHIEALNRLLAAYRVGSGRTPEKALDALDRTRDVPARLAALIEKRSGAESSRG